MKKQLFTLLISFFTISIYSQIHYEEGYIISEDGNKLEVLIRNQDWKNNPTTIEYKASLDAQKETISIEHIKEFGVKNISKYVKYTVNIDTSPVDLINLSYEKNPIFEEQTVLLKTLVKGDASLYKWESGNNIKFFIKTTQNDIEQLIFKEYRYENFIKKNNHYRKQIYNQLKCENISYQDIKDLEYVESKLTDFFRRYNKCKDPDYKVKFEKVKKDLFNLNLRPGMSLMSLSSYIENHPRSTVEFEDKTSWRIGAEAEFILPFNKNKWSVFVEASYQKFESEGEYLNSSNSSITYVEYGYLDISIGARFYIYLNDNSKFFANLAYVPTIVFEKDYPNSEVSNSANYAAGIGFKYLDKYGLEVRYGFNRNILHFNMDRYTKYNTTSLILSYNLF